MRRALVLSGGGARGSYHVGALLTLIGMQRRRYEVISGTSVGALIGAYIAQWQPGDPESSMELARLWRTVRRRDLYRRRFPWPWNDALYDTAPLRRFIKEHIGFSRIGASGVDLRVQATDLHRGRSMSFGGRHLNTDVLMASAAVPVAFPPVYLDGRMVVDGSVLADTPLGAAIRAGATDIDVIALGPADPEPEETPARMLPIAARTIEVAMHALFESDLRSAKRINEMVRAGYEGQGREVSIRVLRPSRRLEGSLLAFDPQVGEEMRVLGCSDAARPEMWTEL